MGPRFDETQRGRRFFDAHIPKLIKAIEENTAELKRANELKEVELYEEYGYKFVIGGEKDESLQTDGNGIHDGRD